MARGWNEDRALGREARRFEDITFAGQMEAVFVGVNNASAGFAYADEAAAARQAARDRGDTFAQVNYGVNRVASEFLIAYAGGKAFSAAGRSVPMLGRVGQMGGRLVGSTGGRATIGGLMAVGAGQMRDSHLFSCTKMVAVPGFMKDCSTRLCYCGWRYIRRSQRYTHYGSYAGFD